MKYALVTGGSRGIGKAICLRLASMGYYVIVNYVSNRTEAEKTLAMLTDQGGKGELMQFDVGNRESVEDHLERWHDAHPGEYIEVLVNNAGIRRDGLMLWMEPRDWKEVLDVSLNGFYNVTQPLLKNMLVKKHGRIINMSSVSGLRGTKGQVNYAAAKGAIIAATKTLALEVAAKGVTVNAVAPGFIRTDMVDGLDESAIKKEIPLNRLGEPEEVADLVAFLASDKAAYITGEVISINGGLY